MVHTKRLPSIVKTAVKRVRLDQLRRKYYKQYEDTRTEHFGGTTSMKTKMGKN
jgi:hypothetical protein